MQHLEYSINIEGVNGDFCEIFCDDDLQRVVAMFSRLVLLDLPVSIKYCSWYTEGEEME